MKKIYRLKLQRDFDNVFKNGRNATADGLTLKYARNELKHCRLSEIISKKTAKTAVEGTGIRDLRDAAALGNVTIESLESDILIKGDFN